MNVKHLCVNRAFTRILCPLSSTYAGPYDRSAGDSLAARASSSVLIEYDGSARWQLTSDIGVSFALWQLTACPSRRMVLQLFRVVIEEEASLPFEVHWLCVATDLLLCTMTESGDAGPPNLSVGVICTLNDSEPSVMVVGIIASAPTFFRIIAL
jgi:hypothetical protein